MGGSKYRQVLLHSSETSSTHIPSFVKIKHPILPHGRSTLGKTRMNIETSIYSAYQVTSFPGPNMSTNIYIGNSQADSFPMPPTTPAIQNEHDHDLAPVDGHTVVICCQCGGYGTVLPERCALCDHYTCGCCEVRKTGR
jgi:hypothetical protein